MNKSVYTVPYEHTRFRTVYHDAGVAPDSRLGKRLPNRYGSSRGVLRPPVSDRKVRLSDRGKLDRIRNARSVHCIVSCSRDSK